MLLKIFHLIPYDLLIEKYFSYIASTPSILKSEFLYWVLLYLLFRSPLIFILDGNGLILKSLINLKIFKSNTFKFLKG